MFNPDRAQIVANLHIEQFCLAVSVYVPVRIPIRRLCLHPSTNLLDSVGKLLGAFIPVPTIRCEHGEGAWEVAGDDFWVFCLDQIDQRVARRLK